MSTHSNSPINYGSGILREAIKITFCPKNEATHFAICHGSHIKFLVQLKSGIPFLRKTVAAYNKKLSLLLHLLPYIPTSILRAAGLGYFARITLHHSVKSILPESADWNILVGTYDSAQKLVFQCFSSENAPCTFIKIGNYGSAEQMEKEIRFLKHSAPYQSFDIPHLRQSTLISEGAAFNILVTDEFNGTKILPVLNHEICRIAQEIAGEPTNVDGVTHTFSHGDFAPWNIRKNNSTYTVFDWEHCGLRPCGYDLIYFCLMVEIALNHHSLDKAYDLALNNVKQFIPELAPNKELILAHFRKTTKTLPTQ